jgi:hypothetical protein
VYQGVSKHKVHTQHIIILKREKLNHKNKKLACLFIALSEKFTTQYLKRKKNNTREVKGDKFGGN